VPLVLVRHASAGSPEEWRGDDRERPLDPRGIKQAKKLVRLLADLPIDQILTSPYLRCIETIEPLAAARGLVPEARDELTVERQDTEGVELVRNLAGESVLVCGHGGLETAISGSPRLKKGRALVVGEPLEVRKP
jgi:8-oxo-dGTP diphosphatase